MRIPEKFTINSQEITVELVNTLPSQNFGEYCCITDKIKLATNVKDDDGTVIPLKEEQIENTFWHELLHAFNGILRETFLRRSLIPMLGI